MMASFSLQNQKYRSLVQAQLEKEILHSGILPELAQAMWYSINAGGKRLRPCLLLAACEMFGGDIHQALPLAAAVEMIHTYSLIHDDLPCMDNDDFRRGKPTNHKVYGEAFALLAGDGLLSLAFESMVNEYVAARQQAPGYASAMAAIAHGAGTGGMVAGQWADLNAAGKGSCTEGELRSIHLHKTGALISASVMAGALLSGREGAELGAMKRFAENYGVLFQITDDILDFTGDFESMGKTLGKDEIQGKATYVTLFGLEKSRELAHTTADAAVKELQSTGLGYEYFAELVQYTLTRKN